MTDEIDKTLQKVYYDASSNGSYGGIEKLARAAQLKLPYVSLKHMRRRASDWLKTQNTYTLHKPIRKNFKRNATLVHGIDEQWQADLVDMQQWRDENRGYGHLLTVIDIFSKYAWARPLKTKLGNEVAEAFSSIFQDAQKRSPQSLQTDKGKEFFNTDMRRLMRRYDINHFATENSDVKAAVVERFNRTLKSRMWRYFTEQGHHRYIQVLPQLLRSYNASYHRTIGMAPNQVKQEDTDELWKRMYEVRAQQRTDPFKFKVGDKVRISKFKVHFEKGYLPNWTDEIFIVTHRMMQSKPRRLYKLKDVEGEPIRGSFYEDELQRVVDLRNPD